MVIRFAKAERGRTMLSYQARAVGWGGRPRFMSVASKENEMPSLEQEDGADMECGDSATVQMAQVSCCMALEKVLIEHIASTPHTLPLCR